MMGMSGAMGAWILLWSLVGLAVLVTGGFVAARALGRSHRDSPPQITAAEPALRQARDTLRMRYAHGEISREEYLQGKVELED